MPLNWTVEQFNTWVDATFPDNQTRMISEADLRDGFKNTVQRSDERAAASEAQALALNNSFIARSLSLHSVIYVDGVNGNDARTGTTNDNNAATGRVKTLGRVAQLHNDKTRSLNVIIVGNLDIQSETTFIIDTMYIQIAQNIVVTVKKKTIYDPSAVAIGEGPWRTNFDCREVFFSIYIGGSLIIEPHAGSNGLGNQSYYPILQCAFQMISNRMGMRVEAYQMFFIHVWHTSVLNIGANQTFVGAGPSGYYYLSLNPRVIYKREMSGSGSTVLGANAIESICTGDRTLMRQYHPTSSTDAKVTEGESVLSPTNNKIWTKRGGTIRDAMGTTFA